MYTVLQAPASTSTFTRALPSSSPSASSKRSFLARSRQRLNESVSLPDLGLGHSRTISVDATAPSLPVPHSKKGKAREGGVGRFGAALGFGSILRAASAKGGRTRVAPTPLPIPIVGSSSSTLPLPQLLHDSSRLSPTSAAAPSPRRIPRVPVSAPPYDLDSSSPSSERHSLDVGSSTASSRPINTPSSVRAYSPRTLASSLSPVTSTARSSEESTHSSVDQSLVTAFSDESEGETSAFLFDETLVPSPSPPSSVHQLPLRRTSRDLLNTPPLSRSGSETTLVTTTPSFIISLRRPSIPDSPPVSLHASSPERARTAQELRRRTSTLEGTRRSLSEGGGAGGHHFPLPPVVLDESDAIELLHPLESLEDGSGFPWLRKAIPGDEDRTPRPSPPQDTLDDRAFTPGNMGVEALRELEALIRVDRDDELIEGRMDQGKRRSRRRAVYVTSTASSSSPATSTLSHEKGSFGSEDQRNRRTSERVRGREPTTGSLSSTSSTSSSLLYIPPTSLARQIPLPASPHRAYSPLPRSPGIQPLRIGKPGASIRRSIKRFRSSSAAARMQRDAPAGSARGERWIEGEGRGWGSETELEGMRDERLVRKFWEDQIRSRKPSGDTLFSTTLSTPLLVPSPLSLDPLTPTLIPIKLGELEEQEELGVVMLARARVLPAPSTSRGRSRASLLLVRRSGDSSSSTEEVDLNHSSFSLEDSEINDPELISVTEHILLTVTPPPSSLPYLSPSHKRSRSYDALLSEIHLVQIQLRTMEQRNQALEKEVDRLRRVIDVLVNVEGSDRGLDSGRE